MPVATDLADLERRLWESADQLRANSSLTPSDYRGPILGLIFLAFAEHRFLQVTPELEKTATPRNPVTPDHYRAKGVLYVPDEALLSKLVALEEGVDGGVGKKVDEAMAAIEAHNTGLKDVLPRGYPKLESALLQSLLRLFAPLPRTLSGDAFGLIYEYFLSSFAMAEGRLGGEFFTPQSIVRLIVEIIEPYEGKVFDPACGSGGMFVQCAKFVGRHQGSATRDLSVYGMEQKEVTVPIGKMNLALHGLSGDIRQANSYYEDPHSATGAFDFVMANPPFNVNGVDKAKLDGQTHRLPYGIPRPDNGNYVWIQLFASALSPKGRAGFVMANSASDARSSEAEIRRQLIEDRLVDVMVAVGPNMFYSVTLPVTLWFFDKAKRGTDRADQVLFIDARNTFRQIDRAHRDFRPDQIELLANIVRLYRGEQPEFLDGSQERINELFPAGNYADVPGLCRIATLAEIEAQGWSLSPGRYVGTETADDDGGDFVERLATLHAEFTRLSDEAEVLQRAVDRAVQSLVSQ
jgi:type I restriction enzyme M protein